MSVPADFARAVTARLAILLSVPVDSLAPATPLREVISDSFMLVEVSVDLQEEFDVILRQEDLAGVVTVADLTALLHSRLVAAADEAVVRPG